MAARTREGPAIGLVGATGLVGSAIIRALEQQRFPAGELRLWAGSRSAGNYAQFRGRWHLVRELDPADFRGCRLVFFAGTEGERGASRLHAKAAIDAGAVVIDNGSDFRMDPRVPLVVPEVNPGDLKGHRGLIANPNCSTIQLVVALAPVHRRLGLKRVVVSTYQSVSGAGRAGLETLRRELDDPGAGARESPFKRRVAGNVIPQIGDIGDSGLSAEEWKMVQETRKILHGPKIAVSATAVRVPVEVGHAESVYFETSAKSSRPAVERLLSKAPGVVYSGSGYHTPAEIAGRDEVFVSRLRADPQNPRAFSLWCAADNLRKGAGSNAVQIAWLLYKKKMLA